MTMWTEFEVIFDRSESQKPTRTHPLVNVPRIPVNRIAAMTVVYGSKELDVTECHPDDVVVASLLAVW